MIEAPRRTIFQQIEDIAREMTGDPTATPFDAFLQWENEREALSEIWDEHTALTIQTRYLDLALILAERVVTEAEQSAGMFLPQATRDRITEFRALVKSLEARRLHARELLQINALRKENIYA